MRFFGLPSMAATKKPPVFVASPATISVVPSIARQECRHPGDAIRECHGRRQRENPGDRDLTDPNSTRLGTYSTGSVVSSPDGQARENPATIVGGFQESYVAPGASDAATRGGPERRGVDDRRHQTGGGREAVDALEAERDHQGHDEQDIWPVERAPRASEKSMKETNLGCRRSDRERRTTTWGRRTGGPSGFPQHTKSS